MQTFGNYHTAGIPAATFAPFQPTFSPAAPVFPTLSSGFAAPPVFSAPAFAARPHFHAPVHSPLHFHTAGFRGATSPVIPAVAPAASVHLKVPSHQHKSTDDTCMSLVYWPVRGLASPIRMLLAYVDACFDETSITDASVWFGDDEKDGLKKTLREENPFINLPYFEDGALVLSQSGSILRHLGRKFNLVGCSEIHTAKIDMLLDQLVDFRTSWSRIMYATPKDQFEDAKQKHLETVVPDHLTRFAEWLALNKTGYLVENHITIADLVLWELLDIHSLLEPTVLDAFPTIQEYHARIRAEPRLAKYFDSEAAKFPLNGAMANFNTA